MLGLAPSVCVRGVGDLPRGLAWCWGESGGKGKSWTWCRVRCRTEPRANVRVKWDRAAGESQATRRSWSA